ncbi:hypothetical protein BJV74DRAFT_395913 [Russula compacta]|nr:hypothetical protein BJV74DRAFT_395913 [Russula compacta]
MFSPFTFTVSVPGIINPFSKPPYPSSGTTMTSSLQEERWVPGDRPHPSSLPPPVPLARKRGWQPSSPEPSPAVAVTTSTSGHLNVHPRYRDFTVTQETREENEGTEMPADLPPAKRRRTLAGAIFSGAVNAALIGTAVGLTVFRLWRDRGKAPELEPPPYEQGDWVPSGPEETTPATIIASPPRIQKSRSTPNTMRRGTTRHRRVRTQVKIPMSPPRLSRNPSPHRPTKLGSDSISQPDDLEDRMDWMGSRLSRLIEDGKKALGKEVVVMSEAQEDEEDDGNGNWEEEVDPDISVGGVSRSSSIHRSRIQDPCTTTALSDPYLSPPSTASPHRQQFSTSHLSHSCSAISIPGRAPHGHPDDTTRLSSSFREDEYQWQSPELRESMERARAGYIRNRQ